MIRTVPLVPNWGWESDDTLNTIVINLYTINKDSPLIQELSFNHCKQDILIS
jgi:hypothetical protein